MTEPKPRSSISIDIRYVVGQLVRAMTGGAPADDTHAREKAAEKVRKWRGVLHGMLEGALDVGSRTPAAGAPEWVTLEVAQGGFATGRFLAGGDLQPHELALRDRIAEPGDTRLGLNEYYLSEVGRAELGAMLLQGKYRIDLPEEGALPTVWWLVEQGAHAEATALLAEIAPWFDLLRFYPTPSERPRTVGTLVHLQPVGETLRMLRAVRPSPQVAAMNEALLLWAPLYDRIVALFLETVEGDPPSLRKDERGELLRSDLGQPVVQGGWPCRRYPDGWSERARTLLDDFAALRTEHHASAKPLHRKENFSRLKLALEQVIRDPASLVGRDVGMIRKVLASHVARWGSPGSPELTAVRAAQKAHGARPTHHALRRVLLDRMAALPPEAGIRSVDEWVGPATEAEGEPHGVPAGAAMPRTLARKLRRSLEAPVEDLVHEGVITSGELLGKVLPQLTAQVRSAGISDPALRGLYAAVYAAFRRRRSLLLLDLQHQIRIGELPWVAAIEPFRRTDDATKQSARETLAQLASLFFTSFPETIVPNKLLGELGTLATAAGLALPLVDELAVDIFTGVFTAKFLRAAQLAGRVLRGTLYARYYAVDFDEVLAIDDLVKSERGAPFSRAFAALCERRAGTPPATRLVAWNGKVVEQQQILTTHNLVALVHGLDLLPSLDPELPRLARRCFTWICDEHQVRRDDAQARLQMVKNTAYAW
ncbi:MAG: hypothetical protein HOO96_13685, partial [Polyangiaceae bacterium]|nr:hypothetical protein [Polyangiaceae bacterium]